MEDVKSKAKELVEKFLKASEYPEMVHINYKVKVEWKENEQAAKQCALIAVDEVINSLPMNPHNHSYYEIWSDRSDEAVNYWEAVKNEILKL